MFALDVEDRHAAAPKLAAEIECGKADGVLGLGTGGSTAALVAAQARRPLGRVKIGTFDLTPEVLEAIRTGGWCSRRSAGDYLQGYMPIVMLAQQARWGLFPSRGEFIRTGPNFVTRETADLALPALRGAGSASGGARCRVDRTVVDRLVEREPEPGQRAETGPMSAAASSMTTSRPT